MPVSFQIIQKTEWVTDKKSGKQKLKFPKTKNEYFRKMVVHCQTNQIPFKYMLADAWFSSAENMTYLKKEIKTDFIFLLKDNRKIAFSQEDKKQGHYVSISSLEMKEYIAIEIWLEEVDSPLQFVKQVSKNKDSSQSFLYLATGDTSLSSSSIQTIYQKR